MLAQFHTDTVLTSFANGNLFWTDLNGVLVMGGGSTANLSLYTEVSGVPAAVTYTPATAITGLYQGVIGGATSANRLFVCMAGTAIDVHSVAGTSLGSMHANTSGAYGVIQSPINAATPGTPTLLIYSNNSIYTLSVASAIGTAPTQVLSGIPNGGAAMGIEQVPKNWPLRAFWVMPDANRSSSWIGVGGNPALAKIYHTNLEGTDRQVVPLSLYTILSAGFWDKKVVATDGVRIVTWDGDTETDLHGLNNRPGTANVAKFITGIAVRGGDLYMSVLSHDLVTFGNSTLTVEKYIPEFDAWVQVSSNWTPTALNVITPEGWPYNIFVQDHAYSPTFPVGGVSSRIHIAGGTTHWHSMFLAPSDANPYYRFQQTGSDTTIPKKWEASGTWTSPYYMLPTLEGRMKKVDTVVFGGIIAEGNVRVTINPNQGGTYMQFSGTDATRSQNAPAGDALFDLMQVGITLTQGSSTLKTPNGLPVTIRGRVYMNDPDIQTLGLPGGFI